MHKTVVAALAALSTFGLAGAAFAQTSNSGNQTPASGAPAAQGQSGGMNNANGPEAKLNTPAAQMKLTQVMLSSMGLYRGPIDGVEGQETNQAIKTFQSQQNLPQTGKLDQATLSAVGQMMQTAFSGQGGGMESGRAASEPQGGQNQGSSGGQGSSGNMNNSDTNANPPKKP